MTPAIDQYFARYNIISIYVRVVCSSFHFRHGLEGLETEQAKLSVLKWVGRDKSKAMSDKSKAMADKSKPMADKSKTMAGKSKAILDMPKRLPVKFLNHFKTGEF